MRLLKNKFPHVVFLLLMIGYAFSAQSIYVALILKHGKPIAVPSSLPAETQNLDYDFGEVAPTYYDGEHLYVLSGYGLLNDLDPKEHHTRVLLHSTTRNLIFDTNRIAVPNIIKRRKDYVQSMKYAEFKMMFSGDVIPPDNYRIGLLIEDLQGNLRGFKMTNTYLDRSPNSVRLINGKE